MALKCFALSQLWSTQIDHLKDMCRVGSSIVARPAPFLGDVLACHCHSEQTQWFPTLLQSQTADGGHGG